MVYKKTYKCVYSILKLFLWGLVEYAMPSVFQLRFVIFCKYFSAVYRTTWGKNVLFAIWLGYIGIKTKKKLATVRTTVLYIPLVLRQFWVVMGWKCWLVASLLPSSTSSRWWHVYLYWLFGMSRLYGKIACCIFYYAFMTKTAHRFSSLVFR